MSDNYVEDNNVLCPAEGKAFYTVGVEILTDDPETGKIKKMKEEHLVEGANVTEVETKVKKEMEMTSGDWKITKCQISKVISVY